MSSLTIATLALYGAAALAAVVGRFWAIAGYLGAVLVTDGLRWAQVLLLPSPPGVRAGWWLVAWWGDVGLYTASLLMLPAMAVVVFGYKRQGALFATGAAWLLLTTACASGYPNLRGPALLRIYDLVELGAVVTSLGCVVAWWRSGRVLDDEGRSPAHLAGLALIAGPSATITLPWIGGDVLQDWSFIVAANAVTVGIALVFLLWGIINRKQLWA